MSGIIVGIDGSSHSVNALEWAMKEGTLRHAPVTVVTVHSVPANPWTGNRSVLAADPAEEEKARRVPEELTRKAASQIGDAQSASITIRAVTGYPANDLIAASRDADLVVVGSPGAGGFGRLVMGSVSSQVGQHAYCPVVVTPGQK